MTSGLKNGTTFWNQECPSQWLPYREPPTAGRSFACGFRMQDCIVFGCKFFIASLDLKGNLDASEQQLWTRLLSSWSCSRNFPHLPTSPETQGKGKRLTRNENRWDCGNSAQWNPDGGSTTFYHSCLCWLSYCLCTTLHRKLRTPCRVQGPALLEDGLR